MDVLPRLRSALAERYEIERELGRGGMAIVYVARDLRHDRHVAIKVLRPELSVSLGADRFLREIHIAAQLQHPHILALYDSGEADGLLYYVMPYVEGETLGQRLRRETQLPVAEALQLAREVAEALSYAHSHEVVHRDIKPDNVMLTGGHALVADFGIARAVSAAGLECLTDSGMAIGTPAYMSPEQGTGSSTVDGRADVYSLGCVLYEMLAGEPPFSGPTGQAIIARHVSERPPSLQIVRPAVSRDLEDIVTTALAKVPADRFSTAGQFADAIRAFETGTYVRVGRRVKRQRLAALAAVGLLGVAAVVWRLTVVPQPPLDPNRVVVYPLVVSSDDAGERAVGEGVAALMHYALDGAGSLRSVEGWYILDESYREDVRRLPPGMARSLTRAKNAGFFLDGRIVLRGDSADVMLALRDVRGDSVMESAMASGPAAEPWRQGLRALTQLLPTLIPGEPVDVSALSDRHPTAVAHFLEGEREYRHARFDEALPHYERAVEADSLLAIAALKGAEAASWNKLDEEAEQLVNVALEHQALLPTRHAEFARGLRDRFLGAADSAVARLKRELAIDPEWRDAWMVLGEVYTHLLPAESPLDSLAQAAFQQVRWMDTTFAPPLFHLLEFAVRDGDMTRAEALLRQFRESDPDSSLLRQVSLMFDCVEEGISDVDWRRAVQNMPDEVHEAAKSLSAGGRQFDCAEGGWRAILRDDTGTSAAAVGRRWATVNGLQGLLVAQGRFEAARQLLDSAIAAGVGGIDYLYVLDAAAGAPFDSEAAAVVQGFGSDYAALSSPFLWLVSTWQAHRGNAEALGEIATELSSRAAATGARVEQLLAESVGARAALARSDSATALRRLRTLAPTSSIVGLTWYPWECLAAERMALAELLLHQGHFKEALQVAQSFDSATPVTYLMYLPVSLSVRLQAAQALGDDVLAQLLRARLAALGRNDLVGVL